MKTNKYVKNVKYKKIYERKNIVIDLPEITSDAKVNLSGSVIFLTKFSYLTKQTSN